MGAYDRPKENEVTREQLAAWDKGYRASENADAPSLGGLYRGEERYYIAGFNRSRVERGELLIRLAPLQSGGYDLLEEKKNIATEPTEAGKGPYVNLPEGEIRTTSSTGGMKGVKPERYSLIPVEALASIARLYAFGAVKYAAHNWRKGYEWSKSYDSLFRHASASLAGEDYDEETGEPHLAGVVFHAFTLMCYLFDYEQYGHFDDRYKADAIESQFEGSDEEIAEQKEMSKEDGVRLWTSSLTPKVTYNEEDDTVSIKPTTEQLMQEYQGVAQTPIDQMIDYLAGMYDNWSVNTAKELRRVAKDLRQEKHRNVKSFDVFREEFPLAGITGLENIPFVGTRLTEIEPMQPTFNVRSKMVIIPTVVGAVYYCKDKHVVGSFQLLANTEIETVALPGYRFASEMPTNWLFLA